jgi:hypothetical protein
LRGFPSRALRMVLSWILVRSVVIVLVSFVQAASFAAMNPWIALLAAEAKSISY